MTTDKRAFKRLAFSKDSEIRATLIDTVGDIKMDVKILNVSQGGLGLAAERGDRGKIKEEIELQLQNVTGGTGLPCLKGQKVKVKWILNYEPLENLGIGCEFVGMNQECIEEINALLVEEN